MAGSIVLAVKSVFDDAGLKSAQKEFGSIGKKIKGGLAALGLGVGLAAGVSALKEAGKAAVGDAKSQAILANALKNTVGASDGVIASVEEQIRQMQYASGVADDNLRPAYQSLVTATGSVSESNRLMQLALDLSASKQISVEKAASLLGKAFNGNTTQLTRLMPQLKGSTNMLGDLEKAVSGASAAAAATDPFSRINVIFQDMQEQIGQALIPYIQKFAEYLASPEGQIQMQRLADTIAVVVSALGDALIWLIQNKELVAGLAITITGLAAAIGIAKIAMAVYAAVTNGAAIAQALLDIAMGAINPAALAIGVGVLAASMLLLANNTQGAADAQNDYNNAADSFVGPPVPAQGPHLPGVSPMPKNPQPGQVYTWYSLGDDGQATWYTQTWTGTTWTKPAKMTYTPPETKKKPNPFGDFTAKMLDDAKKIRAIGVLTGKGLSQGFAESIVNSGKDWAVVYQRVIGSNKTALMALQKQWNATSDGLKEIKDAKEKAYEEQKRLDEEYASSVKDTFTGIRESIMAGFDITQMGKSASGLLSNINRLIAQTKKFADNIRTLAGQNLNATLLNQLIAAGPMEGGRLAASLVQSGLGTVQQVNASYSEFQGLSAGIAATGTMAQFGSKAGTVINMTVNAGMGTDAASVGRQVVDAISKYERQSGAVYVRA